MLVTFCGAPGVELDSRRQSTTGEGTVPNRFEAEKKEADRRAGETPCGRPDGKKLAAFCELLFEHAAGEDIVEYDAETLAGIARDAFAFFRSRESRPPSASPMSRARTKGPRAHRDRALDAEPPFIFDSVLGELQALGHAVRLVVHPIFEVGADAAGKVLKFSRPVARGRRPAARELRPCPCAADPRRGVEAALAEG